MVKINLSNYSSTLINNEDIWKSCFDKEISFPKEAYDYLFSEIEEESFWFAHRNNCISEVIKKIPPNGIILDVGGGNGYVTKRLEEEGFQSVLVEPGINGVKNARTRKVKNIVYGTLASAKFHTESIGGICLFDVLEHLQEELSILKTAKTLLKKEGVLYITVPAFNFLWSSIDEYSGHFRRYSLKSLSRLLEQCGYKVLYETYIFSILPIPQFFLRVLPTYLKIIKNKGSNLIVYHKQGKFASATLDKVWLWEISKISKQKSIPIGSSCMVVATKQ